MLEKRLARLRELLKQAELQALMVTKPENRVYMSGFTGSSGLLIITEEEAILVTDFRYTEQAAAQAPGYIIIEHEASISDTLIKITKNLGISELGFEKDHVTYQQYQMLEEKLDFLGLYPVSGMVERLRLVKDEEEISMIRHAAHIADQAFRHIIPFLRSGRQEGEIALELEYFMRKSGASKPAFEIIVASGPRSALPHGVASERRLKPGDLVVMDFGAVYQGYNSDMTRTVIIDKAEAYQEEIYQVVLEAQKKALAVARPRIKARDLDKAARDFIADKGYGSYFGHSLGHGVGMVVHELPQVSQGSDIILEPGMVITVEPGIYLPNKGGVRIEDLVVVTDEGIDNLTKSPKELLII